MCKRRKILTKEEIENIAQYQWASINDIMDIGAIGKNKESEVLKLWKEIKNGTKKKVWLWNNKSR